MTGTVDDGNGPQPLVIHRGRSRVPIRPDQELLVIVELPPALESALPSAEPTDGLPLSFSLTSGRPVPAQAAQKSIPVKMIAGGRIVANGRVFYMPLFPCVADMAAVPVVELSVSSSDLLQTLRTPLSQSGDLTCSRLYYNFSAAQPAQEILLPILLAP